LFGYIENKKLKRKKTYYQSWVSKEKWISFWFW